MTHYITFRTANTAGGRHERGQYYTRAEEPDLPLNPSDDFAPLAERARDKHVVFITHGFNVNGPRGETSLADLGRRLALPPETTLYVAVLWPGDWHVAVVNYPFEPKDALECGAKLGALIARHFRGASAISFASHSLGARVVLEAARTMQDVRAKLNEIALLAAAADARCLAPGKRFEGVRTGATRVSVLSSKQDDVLKYAFRFGDVAGDPFGRALGYRGPEPAGLSRIAHLPIAGESHDGRRDTCAFGHGDYFPGEKASDEKQAKWAVVARYLRGALTGAPPAWG